VAASLVGVGLLLSAFLLLRTFTLMVDRRERSIDICSALFGADCDATLLDASSWILGIPLAGWGMVNFATLACLLALDWNLGKDFHIQATLGSLILAAAGRTGCGSLESRGTAAGRPGRGNRLSMGVHRSARSPESRA
jgi:hypothetical protein